MSAITAEASLPVLLRSFHLPAFVREYGAFSEMAAREGLSHEGYLLALSQLEASERTERRVARLMSEWRRPAVARTQLASLRDGAFLDRAVNVIALGNPGTGKTHLLCALCSELVRQGRPVLFTPTFQIVQRLLAAKRDLRLPAELKRLDRFEAILLDDIGYVQQSREEMEVLFTLLAERYERRSVLITSNLVFSKWYSIFKDPMTTAAAVDRVVHHSVVIELPIQSYRAQAAREKLQKAAGAQQNTSERKR